MEFTKKELELLLAVINDSAFKGEAAEMVAELKLKIKNGIDHE